MKPSLEGNFYPTNRKGEAIKTAAFHLYFSLFPSWITGGWRERPLAPIIIFYYNIHTFGEFSLPVLLLLAVSGRGWGGVLCHTDHGLPWQCPEIYLRGLYGNLTSELPSALVFFQEDLLGGCRHNYACMLESPGTFSTELARTRAGWPGINRGGHTSVLSLSNWMSHFFNELLYVLEKGFPVGNKNSAAFSQQM